MKNKKGIEFSFGWLFALMVGAAILFLAIYAAVKLVGTEKNVQETESAKQLEIILTPVETGYEEGKAVPPIVFSAETRIYNNCSNRGTFGEQSIRVSTNLGVGGSAAEGLPVTSYNKYIFSPSVVQGKEVYAFSKPFMMPFKVANLLFVWNEKYCFVNPPTEIESEVTSLNLKNINITDSITDCNNKTKKVCFYSEIEKCDVIVNPMQKMVIKKGRTVFYEGSLIYGAIFSDPDVYECQVKRLMKRASEIALLYNAKSEIIAAKGNGCSSDLQLPLQTFASMCAQMNKSQELAMGINFMTEDLRSRNGNIQQCKLWEES
jgi:hypothetical protein